MDDEIYVSPGSGKRTTDRSEWMCTRTITPIPIRDKETGTVRVTTLRERAKQSDRMRRSLQEKGPGTGRTGGKVPS